MRTSLLLPGRVPFVRRALTSLFFYFVVWQMYTVSEWREERAESLFARRDKEKETEKATIMKAATRREMRFSFRDVGSNREHSGGFISRQAPVKDLPKISHRIAKSQLFARVQHA
jgi:hypothetical protein